MVSASLSTGLVIGQHPRERKRYFFPSAPVRAKYIFGMGMPSRWMYIQISRSLQSSSACTRTCSPGAQLVVNWFQNSGG